MRLADRRPPASTRTSPIRKALTAFGIGTVSRCQTESASCFMLRSYFSMRILFVCLGNICRSPTAEATMRKLVAEAGLEGEIEVDSAGTGSWTSEIRPIRVRRRPQRVGNLPGRTARRVAGSDFDANDILVPWTEPTATISGPAPSEEARSKSAAARRSGRDVPDPYYGGHDGFDKVLDVVGEGAARFSRRSSGAYRVNDAASAARWPRPWRGVDTLTRVGGGDVNEAWRVVLASGRSVFVKSRADADVAEFAAEEAGLQWLARGGARIHGSWPAASGPPGSRSVDRARQPLRVRRRDVGPRARGTPRFRRRRARCAPARSSGPMSPPRLT